MKTALITVLLLIISNVFMTFAWYGHLKLQQKHISDSWPLIAVIAFSWALAGLEYCFMIPANRMGIRDNGGPFSLFELKIIQEVISLIVFTIIATWFLTGEKLQWNHVCAFLCLMGAVAFTFLPSSHS